MGLYYSKDYFNWQKNIGAFGGYANLFKFQKHIKTADNVIDFGSGGGYLLKNIKCKDKIGIEINDEARNEAKKIGIRSVKTIDEVKNNYANVVISNHALEHVKNPLEVLEKLKLKLKSKGKIILVVPHQKAKEKYKINDVNNHLYTWNPLILGNLFNEAGYKVLAVRKIRNMWPPYYQKINKYLGSYLFGIICKIYAIYKKNYQIKIIAEKVV